MPLTVPTRVKGIIAVTGLLLRQGADVIRAGILAMLVVAIATGEIFSARAAGGSESAARYGDPTPYCAAVGTIDKPDARYIGPAVPDWMARALRRATGAASNAPIEIFRHAVWRCAEGKVMACSYGANIPCDMKADIRRRPSAGARRFCRDQPDAEIVPAYASGRATVYAWRCQGGKPVIVRQVLEIDGQGYARSFWYPVTPELGTSQ